MPNVKYTLKERWDASKLPGYEENAEAFAQFDRVHGASRRVLHCAIPLARAQQLTDFQMPDGWDADKCLYTAGAGKFAEGLSQWNYTPRIRSQSQMPQMERLPVGNADLALLPWFRSAGQGRGLGLNARHLRYHYALWQEMKPKVVRGLHTTLVLATPQLGYSLTPHIQLTKLPLYFSALSRVATPIQLFPARYLYPDAHLGEFADAPAPIFADLLPCTGGFAFPVEDCGPDPWGRFAYFEQRDRYYGYPFSRVTDSHRDLKLTNMEAGRMLLPNGKPVSARKSESFIYATQDDQLRRELLLDRSGFEQVNCLARGTVTHDGLPFQLPVEMQPMVYAIMLTHWRLELDQPGDLTSYTLHTHHAAIRSYHFYQKAEPYFSNFMRLPNAIARDPAFKVYPLANHLNHSWLGGNLCVSDQASPSEQEIGADLLRNYDLQQLEWLAGVVSLWNHTSFRRNPELQQKLGRDGLLFHQMRRILRFDSHLFRCLQQRPSCWPDLHPGWAEIDRTRQANLLPKL
jgi:hypothetical protein